MIRTMNKSITSIACFIFLVILLMAPSGYVLAETNRVNINGQWLRHNQVLKLEDELGHAIPNGFYKYDKLYGFRATDEPLVGSIDSHSDYQPSSKLYQGYTDNLYSNNNRHYQQRHQLGRYKWFEKGQRNDY